METVFQMNQAEQVNDKQPSESNRQILISTSKDTCVACDALYSQYSYVICMASMKDGSQKKFKPADDGTEGFCALAKINCEN